MSTDAPKLSPVEGIKDASNYLRGTIAEELRKDTDCFDKDDLQLLKFHGTYQQDNRDARGSKKPEGGGKAYSFMVRTRVPGGRITSSQMLAELDMCDEIGNTTLKVTTRQALQLHGILKGNLRECIHRINEVQLSTLAACGDVNRNVMCCPAKRSDPVHQAMQRFTDELVVALEPKTRAYHELWVTDPDTNEETLMGGGPVEEHEPVYGKHYLPRKFKIAVGLPEDNCIDLYTNDIGFITVHRDGKVIGYNVVVGGGLGTTPSAAKTFPALGKRMAFVTPEQAIEVAIAIVKVQRDNGNREDRKRARLKYLVHDWGIDRFRAEVERYYGQPLADCTEDDVHGFDDHLGWQPQGDGLWTYGWNIENGRLYDDEDPNKRQWKKALREICHRFNTELRLTAHQSILICDIKESEKVELESIIRKHNIPLSEEISTVRRWSMACVALPTCGLAVTESERFLPSVIDELEAPLAKLGLAKEAFTIRMTGCPNGCARPYNADIGLVGKTKGKYTVFVGGALLGTRLAYIYKDLVPAEDLCKVLVPVFTAFKTHRQGNETLGDFCARVGQVELTTLTNTAGSI